jgi:predicted acetyltransferase
MRPVDDPLRWRFVDARRYHVTRLSDLLWVRLVDVATALEGRTYSAAGTLPVRVVGDSWRPDNNASFVLEVDETGAATCARSHSPKGPHLEVPIDALGAAFLGGTPVAALAAAGRITGPADLVERADRMLATSFQPFCDLRF